MAGAGMLLGIAARLCSAQQPGAVSRKHCLGAGEVCSKGLMEELYFIAFAFNSSSAKKESRAFCYRNGTMKESKL